MRTIHYVYNCGTGPERQVSHREANRQVNREIAAMMADGAATTDLQETVNWTLNHIPGTALLRNMGSLSTANVASYVRADLRPRDAQWTTLESTWPMTNDPTRRHPPRAFLSYWIGGRLKRMQVVNDHQAPPHVEGVLKAQLEGLDAIVALTAWWADNPARHPVARRRTRAVWGDQNASCGSSLDHVSPQAIADAIKGEVLNCQHVLTGAVRNVKSIEVSYPSTVRGVPLLSDHGRALRVVLEW